MTWSQKFLLFFSHIALIMMFHCKSDHHLPPTGLSYQWLDKFTVIVSWKKPTALLDDSSISFVIKEEMKNDWTCIQGNVTNYTNLQILLTEESHSDCWTYNIFTVSGCNPSDGDIPANIKISTLKHRAELVKDFKCLVYSDQLKCSWIPVNHFLNLTISPRILGRLWKCDEPQSSGERNVCNVHTDKEGIVNIMNDIYILVETEDVMSTFKPLLVVPPPKQTIREEENHLNVSLTPSEVINKFCFISEVCYRQCNKPKVCRNTSSGVSTLKVPYDKNCLYEFESKVRTIDQCGAPHLFSDFSKAVTYGSNQVPYMTVVSIVVPIILSISILVSCYCFMRHRNIICPAIPDPSAIFKEMMMTENKELKTAGSLYTLVPEHIDHCKIALVSENLLQKS